MSKSIYVTGDLVWDTHLARLPWSGLGYFQPHLQTHLTNRRGGAWYLRDVVQAALKSMSLSADLSEPHRGEHAEIEENTGPGGVAKGFTIWGWFPDPKPGCWRINEFLGCRAPDWTKTCQTEGGRATPDLLQKRMPEPATTDLLVIDDLGLGFADEEAAWPASLASPSPSMSVIAKGTPPFHRKLWKDKLLLPELACRLTVIVSAAALRDSGAALSSGLSWDRTIEDIKAVFGPGGEGWPLRFCRRVIVPFGRSGAAVFTRDSRYPGENSPTLRFERFVYDPSHLEKDWSADTRGNTFGVASLMTAMVVAAELADYQTSTHVTVSRALAAARELHSLGAGGSISHFMAPSPAPGVEDAKPVEAPTPCPQTSEDRAVAAAFGSNPHSQFRSAFDRALLDDPVLVPPDEMPAPSLLTDALGGSLAFLRVAAEQIVQFGWKRTLESVPRLACGKYFTVDRQEIESLNTIRNLIKDYRQNSADTRPLSIAVYGQPGSGKSFAIKQLAEKLFGRDKAVLEFNLSQFENRDALHEAFHEVRDKSVKGQLPLVFWDEFDSTPGGKTLGWLKEFLAPMQDAEFIANGKAHPFGKCIFIFAGGTRTSFQEFDLSEDASEKGEAFKVAKGPDFVSRLRGFVNIKGPNPISDKGDEVFVIRRAILIRSLLERHHPRIIQPGDGRLVIHPSVLAAFLGISKDASGAPRITRYKHGARSLEAIISLSQLHGKRHFGPSELPPKEVVDLHVSEDFSAVVANQRLARFGPEEITELAAIKHRQWWDAKEAAGYTYGPVRNDDESRGPKTHPLCRPFHELDDQGKEDNLQPARLAILRLAALGFEVIPAELVGEGETIVDLGKEETALKTIALSEHRRWMREKLIKGCSFGEPTSDAQMIHSDIRKFEALMENRKTLDLAIANAIAEFLQPRNLAVVRKI